jgi:twitching motility protein PilT
MSDFSPLDKVYKAQGGQFSIIGLLRSFADPDLTVDGMPRVSDLHFKVGEPVRYRCDGELEVISDGEPLTDALIRGLIYPLLREGQRAQLDADNYSDVDASYYWEEQGINFRLNLFHDRDGLACVMRMLPRDIPEIDEIGFMDSGLWEKLVTLKQGLVLVTGVTGSGKSTTIASIIDYINKSRKCRIITLEDPVEYVFNSEQSLISQRELGNHLKTFSAGLKSALRENPDIIYLGEIRDSATASLALTAAETGHLVFSSLHTKDAKGAYSRIIDMFPSNRTNEISTQLSFSVAYVISQKLLPKKNSDGRIPVFEVLKNTPALGNIVRTGKLHQIYGAIETGTNEGMNTLEQHLIEMVANDLISEDVAIAHANDVNIVNRLS